jgi:aldehyde:ferredoxin oxidoreductase
MWRTWFSLHGLCKLPWNDILPEDNDQTEEPNKVPGHVENYTRLYEGLTGEPTTPEDLILQSERVYNFQRVFNLRMGFGTREHDYPPYRAMGPVTEEEYAARADFYDAQLREDLGLDPQGLSVGEKIAQLREHRQARYEELVDAVYARRGWDENGVPTPEKLKELGINFPEVMQVVARYRKRA